MIFKEHSPARRREGQFLLQTEETGRRRSHGRVVEVINKSGPPGGRRELN